MVFCDKKKKTVDFDKLNIEAKNQKEFAEATEKSYNDKIEYIAGEIANNVDVHKIVLVSGPSASGKTTTSHILMKKLEDKDIASVVVSMDDFFVNRDQSPLLIDGSKDYENIKAINIELFKECMDNLLIQGKSFMPLYDFITGERNDFSYFMELKKKTVIIVEGLHAFNPAIISKEMRGREFKLYVCVNTDFRSKKTILTADNLRFVRRTVRDFYMRGASVKHTREVWVKVLAGEQKFIKPFKKYADFVLDTTHYYEPYLYKSKIKEIATTDRCIIPYLSKFDTELDFDYKCVSDDSLIWEFLII